MTKQKAKNVLYRLCGCKPDYLFAEKVVEIIWSFGNIIEKREKQIEKMKCCANCRKYYRGETADDTGYLCKHHDFNDKCKLWELEE